MKIVHVPTFPDNPTNPAKCNRLTGVITINDSVWRDLSEFERQFWLQHEIGHLVLDTPNELQADRYAIEKCANENTNPQIIETMEKITNKRGLSSARIANVNIDALRFAAAHGDKHAQHYIESNANGIPRTRITLPNRKTETVNNSTVTALPTTKTASTIVVNPKIAILDNTATQKTANVEKTDVNYDYVPQLIDSGREAYSAVNQETGNSITGLGENNKIKSLTEMMVESGKSETVVDITDVKTAELKTPTSEVIEEDVALQSPKVVKAYASTTSEAVTDVATGTWKDKLKDKKVWIMIGSSIALLVILGIVIYYSTKKN